MTSALAEACIVAARASNKLLSQLWIDGSIAMFGYYDANYIFSSTVVLLMSNVMKPNDADKEAIDTAWNLLRTMATDGNLPAIEYCDRLELLQKDLEESCLMPTQAAPVPPYPPSLEGPGPSQPTVPVMTDPTSEAATALSNLAGVTVAPVPPDAAALATVEWNEWNNTSQQTYAPLDDPYIQNFLMQPDNQWSPGTLGIIGDASIPWAFNWETGNFLPEYGGDL